MTDEPMPSPTPTSPPERRRSPAGGRPRRPEYRGEELDPERGPGLGCFWLQVIVLGFFIVIIPIGLNLGWPFEVLAVLLFVVIGLLLLTGQTAIFLMRLVAADRRARGRRRPLASGTRTVGEIEDELAAGAAGESAPGAPAESPPGAPAESAPGAPAESAPGAPGESAPGASPAGSATPGDEAAEAGSPDQEMPDPGVRQ